MDAQHRICVLLMVLLNLGCGRRERQVLDWVRTKDLPLASTHEIALPNDLAAASADARVHVARLADGRTCILLKKSIGWKGNFEGTVLCDAPLLPTEVIDSAPRAYLTLAGHAVFEELYVRARRDDHTFVVYFDLS